MMRLRQHPLAGSISKLGDGWLRREMGGEAEGWVFKLGRWVAKKRVGD
jgi:hypothetical protein